MVQLLQAGLLCLFLNTVGLGQASTPPTPPTHPTPLTPPSFLNFTRPITAIHDETFVPDAVLVFTVDYISQPCVAAKSTVLINGTTPGPEIRLQEGRTSWVRVYNNIADMNVTVHWHGLTMAVSPFSDGTPLASQWPLPPGSFFDYEINIPIGMAGTYFYHSHVEFQAVSATGPLIIEDATKPPYEYDDERIVFLTDVFSKADADIVSGLGANPFTWSGETSMVLINGKGGGSTDVAKNISCNSPLTMLNVDPGKTYRIRFIGGTALSFVSLAFQGHSNLTIIEADGAYTMPQETDHLQIGTGQRFSILLTTNGTVGQDYYMQVESRERPTTTRSFAILSYSSSMSNTTPGSNMLDASPPSNMPNTTPPTTAPLTLPPTTLGWLDYQLRPLTPNDFPPLSAVTRRVTINVQQVTSSNGTLIWVENGYPWFESFPKEPYLVSLIKNDEVEYPSLERALQNGGIDPVTRAWPAMIGEVLEIVLQNTAAAKGGVDFHPFHAHGAHYWDIGSGNGTYNVTENEERLQGTSPVLRDTTMLYRYAATTTPNISQGWRAWRLRVDEPGVWLIHCHILQHMIMGMQTVWVMGNHTELMAKVHAPEVEGYLTYGGDVYGNSTHFPTVVQFQDNWASTQ